MTVHEHDHQWVYWKETANFIYFKCSVYRCKEVRMIDKKTGSAI